VPTPVFTQCDIYMMSDPDGTRVVIPRLIQSEISETRDATHVHFDGDEWPTNFRGPQKGRTVQCRAVWEGDVAGHEGWYDLVTLFDTAWAADDGTLVLRTARGLVAGLDPLEVGSVSEWTQPRMAGWVWSVQFTLTRTQYTVEA